MITGFVQGNPFKDVDGVGGVFIAFPIGVLGLDDGPFARAILKRWEGWDALRVAKDRRLGDVIQFGSDNVALFGCVCYDESGDRTQGGASGPETIADALERCVTLGIKREPPDVIRFVSRGIHSPPFSGEVIYPTDMIVRALNGLACTRRWVEVYF